MKNPNVRKTIYSKYFKYVRVWLQDKLTGPGLSRRVASKLFLTKKNFILLKPWKSTVDFRVQHAYCIYEKTHAHTREVPQIIDYSQNQQPQVPQHLGHQTYASHGITLGHQVSD